MMVRFDTLNKKPKVWNILILSAAVLLLLILLRNVFHVSYLTAGVVLCLYLAAVIVILARAFVRQLRYNPYSYNTIYYAGFALISALGVDGAEAASGALDRRSHEKSPPDDSFASAFAIAAASYLPFIVSTFP